MAILRASYPQSRIEFDDNFRTVWYEALKDMGDQDFVLAIKDILHGSKFFPSIAEIWEGARKYSSSRQSQVVYQRKITRQQQLVNRRNIKKLMSHL